MFYYKCKLHDPKRSKVLGKYQHCLSLTAGLPSPYSLSSTIQYCVRANDIYFYFSKIFFNILTFVVFLFSSRQLRRRQVSGHEQAEHVEAVETGGQSYVSQQTGSPAVSRECIIVIKFSDKNSIPRNGFLFLSRIWFFNHEKK